MIIGARMAMGGKALPYDAEIEYLESTGTQWIDTGVVPSLNMIATFGILITQCTDEFFCSCRINGGDTRYYLLNINNGVGFAATKSTWNISIGIKPSDFIGAKHDIVTTITPTGYSLSVDGVTKSANDSTTNISTRTLPLFGGKTGDSQVATAFAKSGTRCYYAQLVSNGVPAIDLIPVRFTNENGETEGAMYDRVTRALFRNAGTGAFTIGPDL